MTFSESSVAGARIALDAVDNIAESSAPKNII